MTIKLKEPLLTLEGKPISKLDESGKPITENGAEQPFTVGDALLNVLLNEDLGLPYPNPDQKVRAFRLAVHISHGLTIDLTADDVVMLRPRIARYCSVLVAGQLDDIFDGKPNEIAVKTESEATKK